MIKKIGDLPKEDMCRNPEHNPPNMIVLSPGIYEHTCPGCNKKITFTVAARYCMEAPKKSDWTNEEVNWPREMKIRC